MDLERVVVRFMADATEKWKWINGYRGYYKVSTWGRIKSVSRVVNRKDGSSFVTSARILSHQILDKGYHLIHLCRNKKRKALYVHRVVAEAFLSNPENLPEVNHDDGDKDNNRVVNLEWITHAGNQKHAAKNGLMASGERNGMSKLTARHVNMIRKRLSAGESQSSIGRRYGVSQSTVSGIKSGLKWSKS